MCLGKIKLCIDTPYYITDSRAVARVQCNAFKTSTTVRCVIPFSLQLHTTVFLFVAHLPVSLYFRSTNKLIDQHKMTLDKTKYFLSALHCYARFIYCEYDDFNTFSSPRTSALRRSFGFDCEMCIATPPCRAYHMREYNFTRSMGNHITLLMFQVLLGYLA